MRNLATDTESVLLIGWKKCLNGCTTVKKAIGNEICAQKQNKAH